MTLTECTGFARVVRWSGHGSRFFAGNITDDHNRPVRSGWTDGRGAFYCNDCAAMIRSMSPSQLAQSALGEAVTQ